MGETDIPDIERKRFRRIDEMTRCLTDADIERGVTARFSEIREKNGIIVTKMFCNLSHEKTLRIKYQTQE
jgi:hypothetical protein